MLTLLFIVLATVSMIGPTQAVSGVVTASVAVTETFAQLLGGVDQPKPKPTSAPQASLQEWFDAALNDFRQMIGTTLPPQEASEFSASVDALPALTTAGDQSNNTESASSGFGGGGGSGNRAGRSTPGLGGSGAGGGGGGGGASPGSFADTPPGGELAAMDLAFESSAASLAAGGFDAGFDGLDGAMSFDPLDPVALGPGPGSLGPGSGSNPGDTSSIPGAPVPSNSPSSPSSPTPSLGGGPTPSVNSGPTAGAPTAPSVTTVPPRAVIEDLLDDLGVPVAAAAALDPLGNAAAGRQSGTGIFQVPEPSVLLLGAVGTAAMVRRYRQRKTAGHRQ